MRKYLFIFLLVLPTLLAQAGVMTWQDRSVLHSGKWIKIRVSQSGVYQLSYEQLKNAGISRPEHVRIYGYGGAVLPRAFKDQTIDDLPAVPIYMDKGEDGIFNAGDRVLFYAQGPITWSYNGQKWSHGRNTYSDYGYYFISENGGEQKPIAVCQDSISATSTQPLTSYTQLALYEQELINLIDPNGKEGGGKEFYGERFTNNTARTIQFSLQNPTGEKGMICGHVAARSGSMSRFTLTNGKSTQTLSTAPIINDQYTMATESNRNTCTPWEISNTSTESVKITFSGAETAIGYLDYVELAVPSQLRMPESQMEIRNTDNYRNTTNDIYLLTNARTETQIWNVTSLTNIHRCPTTWMGDTLSWKGSNRSQLQTYIAVNTKSGSFPTPTIIGSIVNQNLHANNLPGQNVINYVIVTPEAFLSAAEELARGHQELIDPTMNHLIVTDQQVYNEFSSGTPDATAIRRLMKMLYDRSDSTRFLLLLGDGSFDNRKLLTTSPPNTLITYQSDNSLVETAAYCTDDYFGFLDDTDSRDSASKMRIAVGRFPVNTVEEAWAVVKKTVRYLKNEQPGNWKQQIIFFADDGNSGGHVTTAEESAKIIEQKNKNFILNKLYLDAYTQETTASGEQYPLVKAKFHNMLKNGVLFFDYSGHAGYNTITSEDMLNIRMVEGMTNDKLGFWALATCNFAHFDGYPTTAAEVALLNPNGAAIGIFSADRTVYMAGNTNINRNFCSELFNHSHPCDYHRTIGEAAYLSKNLTGNDENKLAYVLLGDPAVRIHFPTQYQIQANLTDTLCALSTHMVTGAIIDEYGDTVSDFNGPMQVTIYDKVDRVTTNDNDQPVESEKRRITFNDYKSLIFVGEVPVTNGVFEFEFMVPKDIRYSYGNGRMVMHAYDSEDTRIDASGYCETFIVGGMSPVVIRDTIGPKMRIYLNSPYFQNGGRTHDHPHFYAELADENGINTSGAGIGHDLLLIIDEQLTETYVLNQYYHSKSGSYQLGMVSYPMLPQTEGMHTLSFRAWDLIGNSTTKTLRYEVIRGLNAQIYTTTVSMENGILYFNVMNDRPDEHLQSRIYVYNISGQKVCQSELLSGNQVSWNFAELGLSPSVYVYRIVLKAENDQEYVATSGKIIITQ